MATKPYFWTLAHQLKNHNFESSGPYTLALENLSYFEPQLVQEEPETDLEPELMDDTNATIDRIQSLWNYCSHHNVLDQYEGVLTEIYTNLQRDEAQLERLTLEETNLNMAAKKEEPQSYEEAQKLIIQLEHTLQAKRVQVITNAGSMQLTNSS